MQQQVVAQLEYQFLSTSVNINPIDMPMLTPRQQIAEDAWNVWNSLRDVWKMSVKDYIGGLFVQISQRIQFQRNIIADLLPEHLEFLEARFCKNNDESRQKFIEFFEWFESAVNALCANLVLWNARKPTNITGQSQLFMTMYGFIDRTEAEERLKYFQVGTFILRFSDSKPDHFAVAFVKNRQAIEHFLIRQVYSTDNEHKITAYEITTTNGTAQFTTLQDLILAVNMITHFYPNVDKFDMLKSLKSPESS
jgi:hypothetical protein